MLSNGKYIVNGPCKINGEVYISGAKNSTLPIMVASLLSDGEVTLKNVPNLNDVNVLIELLKDLGAEIHYTNGIMKIRKNCKKLKRIEVDENYSNRIRYSVLMLGLITALNNEVKMNMPGGCNLGGRPIDIHLDALKALGVNFQEDGSKLHGVTTGLVGTEINLRFPTVSGTENIIIATVKADGITIINNVAREPEIDDLCYFLNSMGAKIKGIGTKTLVIEGVKELRGTEHSIISDRIETATFLAAAALTGGNITVKNTEVEYMFETLRTFQEMGCKINIIDSKTINLIGPDKLEGFEIETNVYPGMPTDVQPILSPLFAVANGESKVVETIYKERFAVAQEMIKMGAEVKFNGINSVKFNGVNKLKGAVVKGADLRAGAGLVLAGLYANGKTVVENSYQVNRGYENFAEKLRSLGADIVYEE